MEESTKYLEFLKFCLNDNLPVPEGIATIKWHDLIDFGKKHAILGLFIPTVLMRNGKLAIADFKGNKPTDDDVMEWMFEDLKLRKKSEILFGRTQKASDWFLENGFRNCILKGQGNAFMYPDPYLRTSGDVDIWLEGTRDEILAFTTKYYDMPASSLHVHFPMFGDAEVEVHFRPSRFYNKRMTKALWAYFDEVAPSQFVNKATSPDGLYSFFVPTNEFNTFYQLNHVFRHFINEGIGLRQIVDYFYLLRKRRDEGATPDDDKKLVALLKRFNLHGFARAMMYVQMEVLGLDNKYIFTEPSRKKGEFMLDEILFAGNFGKYEERLHNKLDGVKGHLKRFLVLESFRLRLLKHFPGHAIWMPYRDVKDFIYRKQKENEAHED